MLRNDVSQMRIDILTLFPEMITSYCDQSILGIAQKNKLLEIYAHNPRNFATNKHKSVDDTPYGGGAGMVLSPQPYFDCFENIKHFENHDYEIIVTSPSGKVFNQDLALELSKKRNLIILCGRYEGFDQRIKNLATLEISVGDFVLTGGELAALVIVDAVSRLIEGVLGDSQSGEMESFSSVNYLQKLEELQVTKKELEELLKRIGLKSKNDLTSLKLLEYPQYTRPLDFKGMKVPEVLRSGNHKEIFLWRLEQAIKLTKAVRPDLLGIK